ncbi:polymorphic outer membrane protein middle domain-containing protein [Chlamydiifrater phoenicopteri]|uniref:polymorphic outer membrane protein middle domain-containing protein n=1 Tax=Chlamydiifrater phoenicopteri TaxID=2681469 RepID=UPI001BCBAE04|nr:polymorphic outer membrane protein middle domain-containing protein [Chlamydiifrater phoenicopteri]
MMKPISWKSFLLPALLSFSNLYASTIVHDAIPLEGTKEGIDPQFFTLLTTSAEGTTYYLPRRTLFKDFLSTDDKNNGGAFRNIEGPLNFQGNSRLSSIAFQSLCLESALGSSIFSQGPISFSKMRSISVESNFSRGGAIFSRGTVSFLDSNKLLFLGNSADGSGAAILVDGGDQTGIKVERSSGLVRFSNNSCNTHSPKEDKPQEHSGANGGAIAALSTNALILFKENDKGVIFENNRAEKGGALYNQTGRTDFENNSGEVLFYKNIAQTGGALSSNCSFSKNKNSITFLENFAQVDGGAIAGGLCSFQNNSGKVSFKSNGSLGNGGAICSGSLLLTENKDVFFIDNRAKKQGGAVFIASTQLTKPDIIISADDGNVVFDQNKALFSENNADSVIRNALYTESIPNQFLIGAKKDHSVLFYDPVCSLGKGGSVIINPFDAQKGVVVFSGKTLTKQEQVNSANYSSIFEQSMELVQGTLRLEKGASLSVRSFNQTGGTLSMSSGTTLQSTDPEGYLLVRKLCLNPIENTTLPAVIAVNEGGNITLSGTPDVKDPYGIFYEDHFLASSPKEIKVLLLGKSVNIDRFYIDNIRVNANRYGYQGHWTFSWTENKPNYRVLQATWHPSGHFSASPQKCGDFVPTTLWSLFDGLQTIEKTFVNNYLSNNHLFPLRCISFSSSLKGSMMFQGNSSKIAGFSLGHIGGDAVIQIPLSPSTVILGSISKLLGVMESSRFPTKTKNDLLAATVAIESNDCALGVHTSFSYGEETHNSEDSYCFRGVTKGTWKNSGWKGSAYLSYSYPKCLHWMKLTPFAGVEWFKGSQAPFVETGYDPRRFSKSCLENLAIPSGIAIELRRLGKNCSAMTSCKLYYSREFYRKDPVCDVLLSLNNKEWKTKVCSVGKETLSFESSTILAFENLSISFKGSSSQRDSGGINLFGSGSLSIRY